MNVSPGKWIEAMLASVGMSFQLETLDGVSRKGKITGYTTFKFKFNGNYVHFPIEIEINGDPSDRISLNRISSLKVY